MGHSNKKAKAPLVTKPTKVPNGTIRTGQRKPFRKATNQQIEQRIEEVATHIRRHPLASRFDLHKIFCPKFNIKWDTLDGLYIARARKLIAKQANMSKADAREIGLQVVIDLMENGDPKTRLQAEKSFREIHGYSSPTQTRIGGPDGQPLAAPVTVVQPQVNFIIPGNDRNRTNGDKITNGKH